MPRFPAWTFPNVEGNTVVPVEIIFGISTSSDGATTDLPDDVIEFLGLSHIESAASALASASSPTQRAWRVKLPAGLSARHFAGGSAQFAALLALVSSRNERTAKPRSHLAKESWLWATGAIAFPNGSQLPELQPVGGPPGSTQAANLRRKAEAFITSRANIFLCAREDADACRAFFASSEVDFWDIHAFREALRCHHSLTGPTIVGIGPQELKALLAVLFEGLYAKRELTATALIVRPETRDPRSALASLSRIDLGISDALHVEVTPQHALCLFAFPQAALEAGLRHCNGEDSRNAHVAIHTGSAEWDVFEAKGEAVGVAVALTHGGRPDLVTASYATTHELAKSMPVRGYRIGWHGPVLGRRVEIYALTANPRVRVIEPGPWHERNWSRLAAIVATIFTVLRVPCGLTAAYLLYYGHFTAALVAYAIGLATDVFDGYIAREWNGETSWGKKWDGRTDLIFNFVTALGYGAGALHVWGSWLWAIAPFLTCGLLMLVSLPICHPHSAASKIRSGVIRCVLLAFIAGHLSWTEADFAWLAFLASVGIIGVSHELKVIVEEVEVRGEREWIRTPRHRVPYGYHRLLHRMIDPLVPARFRPWWLDDEG